MCPRRNLHLTCGVASCAWICPAAIPAKRQMTATKDPDTLIPTISYLRGAISRLE